MNENKARNAKKKGSSKPRGAKFCPKCGSTNVFWASGLPQLWSIWQCRDCGYRGAFIVENSELAKKLKEDLAEKTAER